ncbi:tetratricopeptide repeat protein [Wenyingzhuangia sp. chi5]|uniref:Tetratricopeptide repeat protein n=1 Tax=Wenyingzhuangia gilva TaxID=3057677 RepID=A0ABT8VQX8_9FLAO|nr:tetratricopeptide repeat protein [Wenyingzhuangia sp. chi5]MDO3694373.1 tetratricopeptide repeat protein [Wenyingzhuangia sp. chi5]
MKTRLLTIFTILFSVMMFTAHAQDDPALRYNMLKTDYKTKNYESALKNLEWCLDNSPKLTANIYKYGGNLLDDVLKEKPEKKAEVAVLGKKMFEKRFVNYPDEDPAKAHSDYADFLEEVGGDKEEIFNHYDQAFKIDPTKLGVGSIISYFTTVIDKYKDTDLQLVFTTYDVTVEAINAKVEGYLDNIQKLKAKQEEGQTLISSEKRNLHIYTVNSKALGQVEAILDQRMEEISTCEYLIPLYTTEFEENKTNKVWVTRAINRMFKKDCTEDPLYASLVEQYQEIDPSPEASVLYAGLLMDKGETEKAISFFDKAISQETDPAKKAKNLYKVADIFKKRGQNAKAVSYAKKAIAAKSNFGRAYTMIATLYAGAVNDCGNDEFEKRMVYVAAKTYALKASKVDPSIGVYASKLAQAYAANEPSKKLVFNNELGLKSGDSYTIKCWIGETVRVP